MFNKTHNQRRYKSQWRKIADIKLIPYFIISDRVTFKPESKLRYICV